MNALAAAFLALVVLGLGFVLCLIWVRRIRDRITEKPFHIIALWSCVTLVSLYLMHMLDTSIAIELLSLIGIEAEPPSLAAQILVTLVLVFYIWTVHKWSVAWSGLVTLERYEASRAGLTPNFLFDGLRESFRIARSLPKHEPHTISQQTLGDNTLPNPILSLQYRDQVRDLILGRWPEYVIHEDAWVEEAQCWCGTDTSLKQPILLLCALNATQLDVGRVGAQIDFLSGDQIPKVIAIFEQDIDKSAIATLLRQYCSDPIIYTFDGLIDAVLPLARYKHTIAEEFTRKHLPNADFAISDIIVDTRIRRIQYSGGENLSVSSDVIKFANYVASWLSRVGDEHLALLGDYGQGKSTAALELTYKLLNDGKLFEECGRRIPLLIRLTGLSPKSTTPEDLLGAWGTGMGLNGRALLALHRAGRTLLIFDAFDEMANVSDRADRLDHFGALWRYACEGSKIMFTGRPNFFLDNEELKRILGISEDSSVGPYCTASRVEPFSLEEIEGSLRWLPGKKAERLVNIIKAEPRIMEIAARPSLLFQLSYLWNSDRLELDGRDIQSASIINSFVKYSIERQIVKQTSDISDRSEERVFIRLRESELAFFTAGCAAAALSEGRNNTLPEAIFRRSISEMWEKMDTEDEFERKHSEHGALAMPLRERLADEPDPIEVCQQVVRTHGVIELDPTRRAVYRFSHKSFAEAVTASVIACGAVGGKGDLGSAWRIVRPRELVDQYTIFQVCFD